METPESQQGESGSPYEEVVALHTQLGTQERAGRVPGLGFGARPTQLFPPSGSRGYQASSSRASQSYEARQLDERLREREQEIAEREARLKADEERLMGDFQARVRAEEERLAQMARDHEERLAAEFRRRQEEFFSAQASASRSRRPRRRSPGPASEEDDDDDEDEEY